MEKYQVIKILQTGSQGTALLVRELKNHNFYVMKKILISGMDDIQIELCYQEVKLLQSLNNYYIVSYHEHFIIEEQENKFICIFMEYCVGGDLHNTICLMKKKKIKFPENMILDWLAQMSIALQHCHSKRILHRDIKSHNMFLDKHLIVKLGDFGISKILDQNQFAQTVVGTPFNMSPEVCQSQKYSYKSDIYSLGCVIYELCNFTPVFQSENLLELAWKIVQEPSPEISPKYSKELSDLVRNMLSKSPEDRPSTSEILNNAFLQKYVVQWTNLKLPDLSETNSIIHLLPSHPLHFLYEVTLSDSIGVEDKIELVSQIIQEISGNVELFQMINNICISDSISNSDKITLFQHCIEEDIHFNPPAFNDTKE